MNISAQASGFTGNKIDVFSVLNQEITVHDYKISKSKFEKGHGECLHLQISINGTKHVLFSGSGNLMAQIAQVARTDFPFVATIKKTDRRLDFT